MNREQLKATAKTTGSKVAEGLAALGLSSGMVVPAEVFASAKDDRTVEEVETVDEV